jgi:hypothetical protein
MEHLGQQKAQLSERLKLQHEQALGEVEKLAKAVLDELKKDLKACERRAEYNRGRYPGRDRGIAPTDHRLDRPIEEVLEQARSEANTLKLISSVWLKALLVGVCTSVGIGLGSWGC